MTVEIGQPHRFVFIRHAQATCNILQDDETVSQYDLAAPLTATGREQAAALAIGLPAALIGDAIFVSPLRRAVDTARALADRHDRPLCHDDRLAEMHVRTTFSPPLSLAAWDALLDRRVDTPEREPYPGMESLADQAHRVQSFLAQRWLERPERGGVTTVVSHAFTIELALFALLGLESALLRTFRIRISNAAVHVVDQSGPARQARLMLVNSRQHLGAWL